MPLPEAAKRGVSLVTGFLGSGKSSLINTILSQKARRRVAVIENELGEIGIDSHLVSANLIAKEDIVSLERGCVCCSLRSDLVDALKELERRETAHGFQFDNVLLETTGVADPGPVVFTFFANPYISSRYRLDSVMCLVDAQHISRLADERSPDALDEAVNQIAFADTILLNKVDLVTDEELEAARDIVRSVNMTAKIIECQLNAGVEGGEGNGAPAAAVRPKPTWEAIMDVNSFSIERALQVDPGFMSGGGVDEEGDDAAATPPPADPADAARDGQPGSGGEPSTRGKRVRAAGGSDEPPAKTEAGEAAAGADAPRARRRLHDLAGVSSVGISATGPLDQFRFNMFMKDLLLEKGRDIMRCKGVLCVKGQEKVKFVFQGVHDTVCFGPSAVEWSEDAPVSQIVFIGRDLDRGMLADGLRSCVWTPLAAGWAEHRDAKSGRPYYVHAGSGDKQWVRPDAEEDGGDPGGDVLVTQAELAALTARGVAA